MSSNPIGAIGPCQVIWDPDGVGLDLSPTFGGVHLIDEPAAADVKHDDYGDTPVDSVFTARTVTVTVNMTESSFEQLLAVIPGAEWAISGESIKVKNPVGKAMFANSKALLLKRLIEGQPSQNQKHWIRVHRCYPITRMDLAYTVGDQRVIAVTFKAFPDDTSGQVGEFYRIGV